MANISKKNKGKQKDKDKLIFMGRPGDDSDAFIDEAVAAVETAIEESNDTEDFTSKNASSK